MTFAFPAFHEHILPGAHTVEAVEAAMRKAGWQDIRRHGSTVIAKVGLNLFSFGETVAITLAPGHAVFRSTCILATQCLDWGKNRRNIDTLLAALRG
jgi:hypothetical protein